MGKSSTSFSAGNTAALKHGFRSDRVREAWRKAQIEKMRELIDRGLGDSGPADTMARDLLAAALADVAQADEYLTAHGGPITVKGGVLKVAEYRRARERDAVALMDRLGLHPKARAVIQGSVQSEGLASQLARQRLQLVRPAAPVPLVAPERAQEAR